MTLLLVVIVLFGGWLLLCAANAFLDRVLEIRGKWRELRERSRRTRGPVTSWTLPPRPQPPQPPAGTPTDGELRKLLGEDFLRNVRAWQRQREE